MYGTYSNSDRSISTLYKVNFMIHTAATSCPQVNNKTVQNVYIESNAHCIKGVQLLWSGKFDTFVHAAVYANNFS